MSRYRRVWVVYRKELLETLRDKRTLAAMVLVPIVLYPILMIIIVQALRAETGRRQAERYSVCVPDELHRSWLRGVLAREDDGSEDAAAAGIPGVDNPMEANPADLLRARLRADQVEIVVLEPGTSLWDAVADQRFHAGLIVEPPPRPDTPADGQNRVVQILHCDTNPRSEFVYAQLNHILANEADRIVRARVEPLPEGVGILTPLVMNNLSTSSPEQQFAKILAMVVPFLLVIMTVTGALYPSIDLTAGERERGTLETLAVSPVPVGQIVAGKFGVIVTIAMFSTALNLGSMTAMFHFSRLGELAASMKSAPPRQAAELEAMSQPAPPRSASTGLTQQDYLARRVQLEQEAQKQSGFITTAAPIVLLAMLPFAVLAGGVMLATCSFARTFKEAQNYMMPVMMAFMIPAMVVSYMPSTRLEGVLLVIPVANIVVLIRELFLGNYQPAAMGICLLSTCFYAAVAVTVAARLYGNESVLFADVGSYKTLFARRFIRAQSSPSPAVALTLVALVFPFYFYWQSYMLDFDASPERLRGIIAIGQVLMLALPALICAWYMKLDFRRTFAMRWPAMIPAVGSILIAVSVVPVANLLRAVQFQWAPPGQDMLGGEAEKLLQGSLASVLFALAVVPGICEELLFRGFLLSGLRQKLSVFVSVVIVGLIFGLFHMYMEKIPVHSLIGMVLALICLRCGSIVPAVLVHIANNALPLIATRHEAVGRFFAMPETEQALVTPTVDARMAVFIAAFLLGIVLLQVRATARPANQ